MQRVRRAVALLLFLLLLTPFGAAFAEEGAGEAPAADKVAEGTVSREQEAEKAAAQKSVHGDEALYRQIQDTYTAAKKRSRRKSFKGYCGAYVANQLVVLGINTSYLSANGKNTYDIYRNMDCTSGGYRVSAYGAKDYSLSEALGAIMRDDPAACNILVGFQKGVSKSGKKYGHTLLIHGVRNGYVYYSDSCSRTVDGVTYAEGEPIVCPLSSFVDFYVKYKLDGLIHFEKKEAQRASAADTAASSSDGASALG